MNYWTEEYKGENTNNCHGIFLAQSKMVRMCRDCNKVVRVSPLHRLLRRAIARYPKETYRILTNVQIEIRTRCNSMCAFCAASPKHEKRPDKQMSLELFEKIINDLDAMAYRGNLSFAVNSDPLMVKDLLKYVKIARKLKANLVIGTNGKLLTKELARELCEAGIDEFTINYYTPNPEERVPYKMRRLHGFVPISIKKKDINAVKLNRAGSAPNKKGLEGSLLGYCHWPFHQMTISPEGKVGRCCFDFYFSNPVGDLTTETITQVWKSPQIEKLRGELTRHNRNSMPCNTCDYIGIDKFGGFGLRLYNWLYKTKEVR